MEQETEMGTKKQNHSPVLMPSPPKVSVKSKVPTNAAVYSVPDTTKGVIIIISLSPAHLVMAPSMGLGPASCSLVSGYLPFGPCGSMSQDEAVAPPKMPQVSVAGQPVFWSPMTCIEQNYEVVWAQQEAGTTFRKIKKKTKEKSQAAAASEAHL